MSNDQALTASESLAQLLAEIRACRACVVSPSGRPLPHEPRPVLRGEITARLAIAGQAPGTRVHQSGIPFSDPSGVRLREWMGVSEDEFYDGRRVAIIPMGFCFPGLDDKGGDRPPRRECAPLWRSRVFAALPQLELLLLVGHAAQRWHLGHGASASLTETVRDFRHILGAQVKPRLLPLPHPSWRNNAWLKANPWFAEELLPVLQAEVRQALAARQ